MHCCVKVKGKGKGHPRTGREGPEGEQMYSSTVSLTSALDGGGWSTPRPRYFTLGNDSVPIVQGAGWATGPVWTGAENLALTGARSPELPFRSVFAIPTELSRPTVTAADVVINQINVLLQLFH